MKQKIIEGRGSYTSIGEVLASLNIKKYLLVYTKSATRLPVWEYLASLEGARVLFADFTPNPK